MQLRSFTELTVLEGFEANRRGAQTLMIGVDARYNIYFLIYSRGRLIQSLSASG